MAKVPGMRAPSLRRLTQQGRVNVPNMAGGVVWPLFDKQTINAAGASVQQFFAVPAGQGGKTRTDTNMTLAGQIPAGQRFAIMGVGIEFYSGEAVTQSNATANQNLFANDVYTFYKSGRLKLTIGSKDYIDHGPLIKFPPTNRLDVALASSTTVAATNNEGAYAAAVGMHWATYDTVLEANQNFEVLLLDLPALPSGLNGTAVVNLYGTLFRNAQ